MSDPVFRHDPLKVVNPKIPCKACGGGRRARKKCKLCKGAGYKAVDLSGMWAPSPGFLVCGGPSLNTFPLERLKDRGVCSLAVNNSGGFAPVKAWCFSDPQTKFHYGSFLDPGIMTFAPSPKCRYRIRVKTPDGTFRKTDVRVGDCPNTFGFERTTRFFPDTFLEEEFAMWGRGGKQPDESDAPFGRCLCTMMLGIRLMCYLGCPRIYMLGVDFLRTEEHQYAFNQQAGLHNRRYRKEDIMLEEIKPALAKAGIEMFNCNPESKSKAFPFVSFEDALADCKGAVPEEPFDLEGWYNKGLAKEMEEAHPDMMDLKDLIDLQKK